MVYLLKEPEESEIFLQQALFPSSYLLYCFHLLLLPAEVVMPVSEPIGISLWWLTRHYLSLVLCFLFLGLEPGGSLGHPLIL